MARIKQIAVFKKPEGQETGLWDVYDVGTVAESVGINRIDGLNTTTGSPADNVQAALEALNKNLSDPNTGLSGQIYSLSTVLDNKVSKDGDTMTGNLNINITSSTNTPSISFKPNNDKATIANTNISDSGSLGFAGLFFNDYNGTRVGRLESRIMGKSADANNPKGQTYMSLSAIGGNNITNQLTLRVDPNGTSKVSFSYPLAWRKALGIIFDNLSTETNSATVEPIRFAIGANDNPYIRWTKKGSFEKHQLVLSSASKTISYQKSNNKPNGDGNLTWDNLFTIGQYITQTAVSTSNNVTTVNVVNNTYTRFPQKLVIPRAGTYVITVEGHFNTNSSGRRKIVISTVNTATSASMLASNIFQKTWMPVSGDKSLDRITSIENFSSKLKYPLNLYLYLYQNSNTTLTGCTGLLKAALIN